MVNLATSQPDSPGCVASDCIYTLAEIRARLKLGQHAIRQARRAGLRVHRIGRRAFLLGRDLIAFVEATGK